MTDQAHRADGPLADTTIGAIRAVLDLYERQRLALAVAIDEITALVGDADDGRRPSSPSPRDAPRSRSRTRSPIQHRQRPA